MNSHIYNIFYYYLVPKSIEMILENVLRKLEWFYKDFEPFAKYSSQPCGLEMFIWIKEI